MTIPKLLHQAKQRRVVVEIYQGKLSARRSPGLTKEFAELLREHKTELLAWFKTDHLIKQIQCGEFSGLDLHGLKKLVAKLKRSKHPHARAALEYLLQSA